MMYFLLSSWEIFCERKEEEKWEILKFINFYLYLQHLFQELYQQSPY